MYIFIYSISCIENYRNPNVYNLIIFLFDISVLSILRGHIT